MRIAHVVTYLSVDGAFGGPISVALAQAEELARRGHEVELLAGWDGRAELPESLVHHRLFRVHRVGPGFVGLASPHLWLYLLRNRDRYDAVHIHLGRDLITLAAARLGLGGARKVVVQTHGMIMPRSRAAVRLVDCLATRRVLDGADTVLVLTDDERRGVAGLTRDPSRIRTVANGVPSPAWTPRCEDDGRPVVMFLARLHPRKRVLAFARMAALLVAAGCPADFEIIGPDQGDLPALRAYLAEHGLGGRVRYRGVVPQGGARAEMQRASVYVLPSVGEVFPMTVLEAMSAGTPAVLTADCGIAQELRDRGAATVTDGSPEALASAVIALLADSEFRARQLACADEALRDWLSVEAVVDRLETVYCAAQRS
ncbi:MAG TPA: glycosyltransferase [Sporichthyaceae bacterium]|nr:glycosyltransferase [Sporichthyaceae bacterium]